MTRQEAIKILEHLKPSNQVYNANDAYAVGQALCMAINSLEIDEAYQLEYEKPTTKNDLGVDAISREDALMCLTGKFEIREYEPSELVSIFSKRIKELPSVTPQEPMVIPIAEVKFDEDKLKELVDKAVLTVTPKIEPRKGHWMKSNIGGAKVCSVCNAHMGLSSFKFCPNCGADMRGVTKHKGKPIEGNNDSYNCENWIP